MSDGIYNVKITQVMLGVEDHGIPTSYLTCEGEMNQGFGGYDLRPGRAMLNWITGIQRVLGVSDWSKVQGQFARVRREDGRLVAIGHIVEDRWLEGDSIYQ